ncbi:hypothetical protein M3Y97_00672600 [Aphelenchoides bicaudatus]|nr:hypothetical protein M3Y97_00672600 [Aphelenchoides bicaudatus]
MLLNQTALNQMLLLNTALQQDILRLSQDTGSFQINDDGSESSRSATAVPPPISSASFTNPQLSVFEAPLDLTMRKLPTHVEEEQQPSTSRPTVIKNGFPPKPPRLEPTTRSCGVKRSTSSLSYRPAPDPDVSDHFRRSLSGKWPRRPANYSHYTINNGGRLDSNSASQQSISSNSTRVTSPSIQRRQGGSNSCLYQTIIGEEEVEDHFRRTFELLRQNADVKNKTADTTSTRL